MKGSNIPAEKSRFAALKIDDDTSDSDTEAHVFQPVKPRKPKKHDTSLPLSTSHAERDAGAPIGASSASAKNAKRRARKKNKTVEGSGEPSKSSASALCPLAPGVGGATSAGVAAANDPRKLTSTLTAEEKFQREMELAIAQSQHEADDYREEQRQAMLHHEASAFPRKATGSGFAAVQTTALTSDYTQDGVLQNSTSTMAQTPAAQEAPAGPTKKKEKRRKKDLESAGGGGGGASSSAVEHVALDDALKLCSEEKRKTETFKRMKLSKDDLESVRIAELTDLLERKDTSLSDLIAVMKVMQGNLAEVKQRNKQLCHIVSKGEMSDKSELVEQVEELSAQNKELTEQVADLYSQLEQERSKSKTQRMSKKG